MVFCPVVGGRSASLAVVDVGFGRSRFPKIDQQRGQQGQGGQDRDRDADSRRPSP